MKSLYKKPGAVFWPVSLLLALGPLCSYGQVPVDDQGNLLGQAQQASAGLDTASGDAPVALLSGPELQRLVGPVALYPDDLLAVVLPASTYPLQVVQAARFLDDLKDNPSLAPDEDWDDSIVALVNYPEVVELLNEDLDWTWQLGEAVVAQQSDVLNAVEEFRNKAYAAGNLKSDEHQTVTQTDDIIEITPVSEEIIYVPYYEPERVVVYQPRPVYYYYPRPCPVYYYPYPAGYAFSSGYFWGVTTAFTIGWGWGPSYLRVYHPSYYGHPYYGSYYGDSWYYRRPTINSYNNIYINNQTVVNNYSQGDTWRPRQSARLRSSDQRIARNRYYTNGQSGSAQHGANQVSVNRNFASGNTQSRASAATVDRQRQIPRAERSTGSVGDMRATILANRQQRERNGQTVSPRENIVARRPDATGVTQRDNPATGSSRAQRSNAPAVERRRDATSDSPRVVNSARNATSTQRHAAPGASRSSTTAQRQAGRTVSRSSPPVPQRSAAPPTTRSAPTARQPAPTGANQGPSRPAPSARSSSSRQVPGQAARRTR